MNQASLDRDRLAKVLGMLGSDNQNVRETAARTATAMVEAARTTWADILTPAAASASVQHRNPAFEDMGNAFRHLQRTHNRRTCQACRASAGPQRTRPGSHRQAPLSHVSGRSVPTTVSGRPEILDRRGWRGGEMLIISIHDDESRKIYGPITVFDDTIHRTVESTLKADSATITLLVKPARDDKYNAVATAVR